MERRRFIDGSTDPDLQRAACRIVSRVVFLIHPRLPTTDDPDLALREACAIAREVRERQGRIPRRIRRRPGRCEWRTKTVGNSRWRAVENSRPAEAKVPLHSLGDLCRDTLVDHLFRC